MTLGDKPGFGDLAALMARLNEPPAPLDEGLHRVVSRVVQRERTPAPANR